LRDTIGSCWQPRPTPLPRYIKGIETSLKTLGTDYLDIYDQHSRHTPEEITGEMIETMEVAKQQGKTRFIGVSTHDPNAMVNFIWGY
jgi:diketogulonate reductase-like aldo/keto reductase